MPLEGAVNNDKDIDIDSVKKDIEIDMNRLKNIFQQEREIGMSLREAVFIGFLMPIKMLNLSVRAYNCIKRTQHHVVGDLLDYSFEDLLKIKNVGYKSAREICQALENKLGYWYETVW